MNILLINHYAGAPQYGMAYRPFYLGREWVRQGHQVTIVGANFSHLRSSQPVSGIEILDGIRYVWLKTPAYHGNGLGRIRNMLTFLFRLYWRMAFVVGKNKPDVVIASSTYPLDIYSAYRMAEKYGAKLVYEVHDLWPLSPMELGKMSKYHPFIMVMQAAENYAYRHVDKVVSILPLAEPHMWEHGLEKGKFVHIPNGIDIQGWNESDVIPQEQAKILESLRGEGKFIVLYAGAHGRANSVITLLLAAEKLKDMDIQVVCIGTGQEREKLYKWALAHNLVNVTFLSPVNKKAIPFILSKADVLYCCFQKQPLFRFGISQNKIMDYMMAGKPIINAIEAGNDPICDADCGISVPAENPDATAKAILQMRELSLEKRKVMGIHGHEYVLHNHDYRVLSKKFLASL